MKITITLLLSLVSLSVFSASIQYNGKTLTEDSAESFMDYVMSLEDESFLENSCFVSNLDKENPEDVIEALNEFVTEGMVFQYMVDDEGGRSIGFDLYDEQNELTVLTHLGMSICE